HQRSHEVANITHRSKPPEDIHATPNHASTAKPCSQSRQFACRSSPQACTTRQCRRESAASHNQGQPPDEAACQPSESAQQLQPAPREDQPSRNHQSQSAEYQEQPNPQRTSRTRLKQPP